MAAHAAAATGQEVDQTLNPLVAGLKVSKTMALTDMARSMRESGIDVSPGVQAEGVELRDGGALSGCLAREQTGDGCRHAGRACFVELRSMRAEQQPGGPLPVAGLAPPHLDGLRRP
ncbi:hypothetical protein MNEG_15219 [Monoraphidium neglectum]|uniref:Uncharacterized protein n=1 Tax=Monoraphidium neglectum TaxID=145388 RepID=A0A0D2MBN4_9CHLO|nr:hypothetical protein MNEG_15219 [Monoraphidium neglectum]KIY92745.1 hypothetical protein MNEG_15219 [Monoraphidium neglectum]|eukprot:XP_013891765.1 hypothetical protein MNEG_15219 [Monoraphidium neglectum]